MRVLFCLLLAVPTVAHAGGYDTPVLYSARHMGMGGAGIAAVNDPTALFMNPAGLAHTKFISLTANFSPIVASVKSSPCLLGSCGSGVETDPAFSPAFLVGASFRVTDFLTLGVAAFPIAAAGGGYSNYQNANNQDITTDTTAITFIEVSPGLAIHGKRWSIGIGYRITIASLQREQIALLGGNDFNNFKLDLSGIDFKGLRVDFQFQPVDGLQIGLVYRHKIQPLLEGDSSSIIGQDRDKTDMDITLPSRLGLGIRGDIPLGPGMHLALASDLEYAFQSQNEKSVINARIKQADGSLKDDKIDSFFNWQDAITLRLGIELGVIDHLRIRAGYIFDEQTANKSYASAFGTPPADTHSGTFGIGWQTPQWEVNVAYAYRHGAYTVDEKDIQAREDQSRGVGKVCLTCSGLGEHEITLHGAYIDFSWYFE